MNQIISKINMELQQRQWHPAIDVVQNDRYMRLLELTLTSGGEVWNIPEEASVVIRYLRSDGIGGEYDTLSDGTSAWSAQENKLTVVLTPEMMTVSGLVQIWVTIIRMEQQISSFALALNVAALAQADQGDTGVFANTTGFLSAPALAEVGQWFRVRAVNDRGQVTEVEAMDLGTEAVMHKAQTLTQEQQAQVRTNIGAVGAPATAVVGQVIAVKSVDENGVPVEWETVSLQGGTATDAVLFRKQELTEEQKIQARANIGAGQENLVKDLSEQIVFWYPDDITVQLKSCFRYGKVCMFTLQFQVKATISDEYGFVIATLPVSSAHRVWVNNATQFYIVEGHGTIKVNASSLPVGNRILSGFFLIQE